jgi:hypothetical protein
MGSEAVLALMHAKPESPPGLPFVCVVGFFFFGSELPINSFVSSGDRHSRESDNIFTVDGGR